MKFRLLALILISNLGLFFLCNKSLSQDMNLLRIDINDFPEESLNKIIGLIIRYNIEVPIYTGNTDSKIYKIANFLDNHPTIKTAHSRDFKRSQKPFYIGQNCMLSTYKNGYEYLHVFIYCQDKDNNLGLFYRGFVGKDKLGLFGNKNIQILQKNIDSIQENCDYSLIKEKLTKNKCDLFLESKVNENK